jgi:hypothetical protein
MYADGYSHGTYSHVLVAVEATKPCTEYRAHRGKRPSGHDSTCYINKPIELLCNYLSNSVAQEPEGSSPHSPQPATGPCPEPVESNPHPPSQSP